MNRLLPVLLLATIATVANAQQLHRESVQVIGRTNVTAATGASLNTRGLAYRVTIAVAGLNHTNDVILLDGDGSVILSNTFTTGGTTTNFYSTSTLPFVGLDVQTFNASSTTITNTVTITYTR